LSDLTPYSIRRLLETVYSGQTRIPAFQRGFVWDPQRVAHFLDSIYKGYPFGSLLFWMTNEQLVADKHLGPFELPDPHKKHPIMYVLDGQQRLTSLFVTFQTEFEQPADADWRAIYFDLELPETTQQPQFVALQKAEVDVNRHFPLSVLFDPVKYRLAASNFLDEQQIRLIDGLHAVFKEAQIPVQVMETDDRATVAVVFERINRLGVKLSTLELLSAWTWSESFDLRSKLEDLQEELEDFGFGDLAADPDLILRCAAAILKNSPAMDDLIDLTGEEIRANFSRVENGLKGAIEFLRQQLHVQTLRTLPYQLILVPLSVFFAVPDREMLNVSEEQLRALKRWFWRSCFSERYSGQTVRAAKIDIYEMRRLRNGKEHSLGTFPADVEVRYFLENSFRMNSARTATFVNMLAQFRPRSFISGNYVNLENVLQAYNKAEFHHVMPKAYLERAYPQANSAAANCLANFCFLSRTDNSKIRAKAPSAYRALMPDNNRTVAEILETALIDPAALFSDDFPTFITSRVNRLVHEARKLMA
jgi:hypothetical protein